MLAAYAALPRINAVLMVDMVQDGFIGSSSLPMKCYGFAMAKSSLVGSAHNSKRFPLRRLLQQGFTIVGK